MISWIEEKDFKDVRSRGLSFIELDVNERVEEFCDHLQDIKRYSNTYGLPVGAVGRWVGERINKNGINEEELELEYRLIDATAELGCDIFIAGCNYVKEISYYENIRYAIAFFEKLIAFGKEEM